MNTFSVVKYYRKLLQNGYLRRYSTGNLHTQPTEINKIRNIGILAHIDAGKTTTTERMLFYSGTIKSMGEVHHGNTVTDYMEQERQRGITITSAAVSFPWKDHQINLIDTPGHIDFTMEVEQSLAVLDGAVVVLDASAGVEAQTITVWNQAEGYRAPRMLYLNKMDRGDADEENCVRSVQDRLQVQPLLLQLPIRHQDKLIGIIDLVTQEELIWTQGRGQKYTRRKLTEKQDGHTWEKCKQKHHQIIDTLSAMDDELAEIIIQQDSLENINSKDIIKAIRNSTINLKISPLVLGSSYKNIGVQTLLDAVLDFLPSPLQCHPLYNSFGKDMCARVFKVIHDDQRGVLSFLRLYNGDFEKGQKLFNFRTNRSEPTGLLYVALADEYRTVDRVTAGNIAVVSGLKETMTGDLITTNQASASRVKSRLLTVVQDRSKLNTLLLPSALQRMQSEDTDSETDAGLVEVLLGVGTTVPDPVFMCTIEPPSLAYLMALETALAELQREDPSLRVTHDEEAGQLVLAGMGELHIEIIKERIIREYKINVELGPLQIAYREALVGSEKLTHKVNRKIGNTNQVVTVTLSAKRVRGISDDLVLKLDKTADSAANLAHIYPKHLNAIRQGVDAALLHGPILSCQMIDVQVTLHWFEVGRGTSESVISAAVTQCLRKIFEAASCTLLEPMMLLSISCPESHSSRVIADLSRRRAEIQQINQKQHMKTIECIAPLSELVGYSSTLRSLSSGLATFTMHLHSRREMSPRDTELAVQRATGVVSGLSS